jgi:hypothetical protein
MPEKFTTSQKTRRTMNGAARPNNGRIGKRAIKDHHLKQSQKKGDRRMNPPQNH